MAFFDFLKKPAQDFNENAGLIYELLFCDDIGLYKKIIKDHNAYPWNVLFDSDAQSAKILEIIQSDEVETRSKILAYSQLQNRQEVIADKNLLAVIIEVGMENGHDVLACYRGGSCRYINQSGKILIWDQKDENLNELFQQLFFECEKIIQEIGPWNRPRLNGPKAGHSRISFLVSADLYFGEAPSDALFEDPLSRSALNAATQILTYITK